MTTAFKNYSGKSSYPKDSVINDILKISDNIHVLIKRLSVIEVTIGV